ncbi:MAG: hypothetical protein RI907_1416 [Pseudomonadota bacterium]|jgi:hypothetical protein
MRFAVSSASLAAAALCTLAAPLSAQAQTAVGGTTDRLAAPEYVYIVTRIDARKCMYPTCGGYFVKAVNAPTTRCADGSKAKECHAVELDTLTNLGWTPEQQSAFEAQFAQGFALVKGALTPQPRGFYTGDVLRVTQAWQAQAKHKPYGVFYGVHNSGIVCIKAPCPTIQADVLNTSLAPTYPDVLLSASGASKAAVEAGLSAMTTQEGIIAVGVQMPGPVATDPVSATASTAAVAGTTSPRIPRLLASEFYLPAKP